MDDPASALSVSSIAAEGFGTVDIAATISPALLIGALLAFSVAVAGAIAASCLAVWSPTKLQKRLDSDADSDTVQWLQNKEPEMRLVARIFFLGGLIGAVLMMERAVDAETLPWALGLLGLLAVVGCGSLPAAIADSSAERTLPRLLPLLRAGYFALRWPLVAPLLAVTGGLLRMMRMREETTSDPEELAQEVVAAVADSTEDGLAAAEKAWIGNIVGLKDLQVSTIMTPLPDLIAIQSDTPLAAAIRLVKEHGFSRYPVYRDKIDEVIGIFYAKDALGLFAGDEDAVTDRTVATLIREPLFVPETMAVAQLLQRFQTAKMHVAIALDEYGNTAGVVTFEDVLEQIVGDIDDEYDEPEEDDGGGVEVVEQGRVIEVSGRAPVGEIEELLGLDLPDGDWETIAGFVIHHANRIPKADETLVIDGAEFRVLQADDRRIGRMRVTAHAAEAAQRHA